MTYASADENRLGELGVVSLGIVIGLMLSAIVARIIPITYGPLEEVRRLGIVSPAVLNNYPKYMETFYYISTIAVTIAVAVVFWLGWAFVGSKRAYSTYSKGESPLQCPLEEDRSLLTSRKSSLWGKVLDNLLLPVIIVSLSYSPRIFFDGGPDWSFTEDQGLHLAYASDILKGKVFYRDFYALYAPLMEYPLALVMRVLGPSILAMRLYNYILNVFAFLGVYFFLRRFLQTRVFAYLGILLFLALYFPLFPAMNGGLLRFALGLFPFLPLLLYFNRKKAGFLVMAGLAVGVSYFYSQEVGTASFTGVLAALILNVVVSRESIKTGIFSVTVMLCGFALVGIPIFGYFWANDALSPYFRNATMVTGIRVLAFPGFRCPNLIGWSISFLRNILGNLASGNLDPRGTGARAFAETLSLYLPQLFYICVGMNLGITLLKGRLGNLDKVLFGILVFGAVLFLYAITLSASWAARLALPPAIVLALFYVEKMVLSVTNLVYNTRSRGRLVFLLAHCSILLSISLGLVLYIPLNSSSKPFLEETLLKAKVLFPGFGVAQEIGYGERQAELTMPRAKGFYVSKQLKEELEGVVDFIESHTKPEDSIFAFPMSPIYYFLVDKKNSTRVYIFSALTKEDRLGIIRDLEQDKTQWILRDPSWVYGIPQQVMFPEIITYVEEYYSVEKEVGRIQILKRTVDAESITSSGVWAKGDLPPSTQISEWEEQDQGQGRKSEHRLHGLHYEK